MLILLYCLVLVNEIEFLIGCFGNIWIKII